MAEETHEPTSTRDENGRWRKGYAPNPKGRPPGSRHTRKAIEMAMNGDVVALRYALNVQHHCARGRPVVIDLPLIEKTQDVVGAVGAIVGAVGEGALTPEEGQTVVSILDAHRRAIETRELDARLAIIEAALQDKRL